ncbi:DUF4434 domain-containing protein [Flavihumibacter rivuli]|uniref:DUF4434 domain-containing protein n=1 Tax=Flavihumibacter rivuli TaxID=2838156 RepID=UPI001BDEEB1E|nr:DUF4434 domain-containing protein [Flavihumibacter rivuli]ULQ55773.1 DUF4434 domain-containing protein [Flavihumibacter rivuli]
MKTRHYYFFYILLFLMNGFASSSAQETGKGDPLSSIDLLLIPPSPVSDHILVDIRTGIKNNSPKKVIVSVSFFLDSIKPSKKLYSTKLEIKGHDVGVAKFNWPTKEQAGSHIIWAEINIGRSKRILQKNLEVISSDTRSSKRIDGSFMGFYHWSEKEGKYWNSDIKEMTDDDWRQMVKAQHQLSMNIIVLQELFRNQEYNGQHNIDKNGYNGSAFYPSSLFGNRMQLAAKDPVEAVLSEADRLGMNVFIAVGMYAWFDFSNGSLKWHKSVANEIWEKYGHHPSFYGWYISEEKDGGLGTDVERQEIVMFFKEFSEHVRKLAPGKPVMLATNSHNLRGAENTYRALLPNLDILCTFGFHRMPSTDLSGEEAALKLQALCDQFGTHFWLDLEIFDFAEENALIPRSIDGLKSDLLRFPLFEKIICYQFPGLLSSPDMRLKPGGSRTIELFLAYKAYIDSLNERDRRYSGK